MNNGDKKDLRIFYSYDDKGNEIMCYDLGYGYIEAEKYHYYKDTLNYTDGQLESIVKRYDVLMAEQREMWEKEKKEEIKNVKELLRFIYKELLKDDEKKYIKENIRNDMKTDEIIELYPDRFKNVIRMRVAYDKKDRSRKMAELKSLESSLAEKMEMKEADDRDIETNNPFIEI